MKHIFVVNPAAGKGNRVETLIDKIRGVCDNFTVDGQEIDYEIYITTAVRDAEAYVRYCCRNSSTYPVRFYACGGDGTLSEVVNGAFGFDNAEVGVIPAGTGNDFVRNFTHDENFKDIQNQLCGSAQKLDLIRYETEQGARYSVNMINIGFDSDVAKKVSQIKRNPFVSDKLAYITGVGVMLLGKLGTRLRVKAEGVLLQAQEMLLLAVGNGRFYGGGFKAAPNAQLDDEAMDLCMVDLVSKATFLKLVRSYKSGTHLENSQCKKIITYRQCRKIEISFDTAKDICVDGEIEQAERLMLTSVPRALNFSVPLGSHCQSLRNAKRLHTAEKAAPATSNL